MGFENFEIFVDTDPKTGRHSYFFRLIDTPLTKGQFGMFKRTPCILLWDVKEDLKGLIHNLAQYINKLFETRKYPHIVSNLSPDLRDDVAFVRVLLETIEKIAKAVRSGSPSDMRKNFVTAARDADLYNKIYKAGFMFGIDA